MKPTQVVVLTQEDLVELIKGNIYAFVNPGNNQEILIMSNEKYLEWREDNRDERT